MGIVLGSCMHFLCRRCAMDYASGPPGHSRTCNFCRQPISSFTHLAKSQWALARLSFKASETACLTKNLVEATTQAPAHPTRLANATPPPAVHPGSVTDVANTSVQLPTITINTQPHHHTTTASSSNNHKPPPASPRRRRCRNSALKCGHVATWRAEPPVCCVRIFEPLGAGESFPFCGCLASSP